MTFIQAKKLKNSVGRKEIQSFVGAFVEKLAELMIECDVDVADYRTFQIKKLDTDYFEEGCTNLIFNLRGLANSYLLSEDSRNQFA